MAVASRSPDLKRTRRSSSNQSPKKARIGGLVETVEGHTCVGDPMEISDSELETATTAQIPCKMPSGGALKSPALQTTAGTAANVCVVTGTMSKDVEICHIIPEDAPPVDIEQLEGIWGLERHSLDVDHPSNLIFLTPELHGSFVSGQWALVPSSLDLVKKLRDFEVGRNGARNIFDVYDKTQQVMFTYDIVPLPGCKVAFGPAEDPSPGLRPPYTTLPKVILPIYPHLVLVNLTAKYIQLPRKEQISVLWWTSDNNLVAGCLVDFCFNIHKRWLPTRKFDHEYAHLPPVDKVLNRLVGPEDSYSQVLKRMGVFDEEDEEEEAKDKTKDFYATRTKCQLRKIVAGWLVGVRKAMDQVDPKHCPPEPSEILPSPPSSPLAPSSGSSSIDRSA